ncbi:major facilitator superfamily domain-containing protein [Halteromyces radiatus]|uniref:major facilitator superfamily domain-containing protein n=1 Tax=Halteromyces radiatus TaxID=101107 RepID=UPI00221FC918|nr:major facilitator superfamily domain-containing protein [Halteromyces radiatus]KAI8096300.1 major facilitator superfamily domain-containing protein [Halteromyces radiatus]
MSLEVKDDDILKKSEESVRQEEPTLEPHHDDDNGDDHPHSTEALLANASWQYKGIALFTTLMLSIGAHFSSMSMSAMKSTMKTHLNIDNTRYGVVSSSVTIASTVLPMLGGMMADHFDGIWGTLGVSMMTVMGSLLTTLAAQSDTYALMVVGRLVFGIGSGLIVIMQQSILSKWFRTHHLSVAIGWQLSMSHMASFLGQVVSNPLADATGSWVSPFWLSFGLCVFSIVTNIIYAGTLLHLQPKTKKEKEKKKRSINGILHFPFIFWLIISIEFIYAGLWSAFQTVTTELVMMRLATSQTLAGYQASLSQVIPFVLSPILGLIIDIWGVRISILGLSGICYLLSCYLLGWRTDVHPTVGLVFFSLSLACGPLTMITSIAMLLPAAYIGTGLGIYKSINSTGTSILDILVGVVQDHTPGHTYAQVMLLFILLAAFGFALIILLWALQRWNYHHLLECKKSIRMLKMKEASATEQALVRQGILPYDGTPVAKLHYIYLSLFFISILVAWILFFVYSVSGHQPSF